jgi:hypothetical protein
MAFKCITSTFAKRLFEQGQVYDSIGTADKKFFKEIKVADDAPVVETGLADDGGAGGSGPEAPGLVEKAKNLLSKKEDPAIKELKEALTELGVEFPKDADFETLQGLLLEAQSNALTS